MAKLAQILATDSKYFLTYDVSSSLLRLSKTYDLVPFENVKIITRRGGTRSIFLKKKKSLIEKHVWKHARLISW